MSVLLSRHEFDLLKKPILPALYRLSARLVGHDWAQSCVNLGVEVAFGSISRLTPFATAAELTRFLARYVHNVCREHLRTVSNHETLLAPDDVLKLVEQSGLDSSLILPDVSSAYYAALRDELIDLLSRVTLTPLQETCVREWLDGVTQQNIGDYLGISQQMVRQHIAAAIEKLRNVRFWQEDHIDPNIERFFWECVAEQRHLIYRKPSHGQRTTSRKRQKVQPRKMANGQTGVKVCSANVLRK